jgi:hypothetical protein
MQLKILNPFHKDANNKTYCDIFVEDEYLINYVLNKMFQRGYRIKSLRSEMLPQPEQEKTEFDFIYKEGINYLLEMQKVWGVQTATASVIRLIWEQICSCDQMGKWKLRHIKRIGKHKKLKKVLSKNSNV